jgi:hypothetical protein
MDKTLNDLSAGDFVVVTKHHRLTPRGPIRRSAVLHLVERVTSTMIIACDGRRYYKANGRSVGDPELPSSIRVATSIDVRELRPGRPEI